jgi:hypothetical protein
MKSEKELKESGHRIGILAQDFADKFEPTIKDVLEGMFKDKPCEHNNEVTRAGVTALLSCAIQLLAGLYFPNIDACRVEAKIAFGTNLELTLQKLKDTMQKMVSVDLERLLTKAFPEKKPTVPKVIN